MKIIDKISDIINPPKSNLPGWTKEAMEEMTVACDQIEAALGPLPRDYRMVYAEALLLQKVRTERKPWEEAEVDDTWPVTTNVATVIARSQALRKDTEYYGDDAVFVGEVTGCVFSINARDPECIQWSHFRSDGPKQIMYPHSDAIRRCPAIRQETLAKSIFPIEGEFGLLKKAEEAKLTRIVTELPGFASSKDSRPAQVVNLPRFVKVPPIPTDKGVVGVREGR